MPLMKAPVNGEYVGVDSVAVNDGTGQRFDYNRLKQIENTLSDQAYQEQTLTHGLNIISTNQPSNMKVEFYGNTLVNIASPNANFEIDSNGDGLADGWTKSPTTFTASLVTTNVKSGTKAQRIVTTTDDFHFISKQINIEPNKYYILGLDAIQESGSARVDVLFIDSTGATISTVSSAIALDNTMKFRYYKFTHPSATKIDIRLTQRLTGASTWDAVRAYAIPKEISDKIGVSLSDSDVEKMFPYIDSVKSVVNPVLKVSGSNLVGKGQDFTKGSTTSTYDADVVAGQKYTLSKIGDLTVTYAYLNSISGTISSGHTGTTTSPVGATKVRITVNSIDDIAINDTKIMFNIGATSLPYTDKNDSYLYFGGHVRVAGVEM